nr:hypothetical protein [Siphonobacter sp. BAB-5405]
MNQSASFEFKTASKYPLNGTIIEQGTLTYISSGAFAKEADRDKFPHTIFV